MPPSHVGVRIHNRCGYGEELEGLCGSMGIWGNDSAVNISQHVLELWQGLGHSQNACRLYARAYLSTGFLPSCHLPQIQCDLKFFRSFLGVPMLYHALSQFTSLDVFSLRCLSLSEASVMKTPPCPAWWWRRIVGDWTTDLVWKVSASGWSNSGLHLKP